MPVKPLAHARFAPSSAEKYLECPGSLTLERGLTDTPNPYSDEGSACHAVAAWCLEEHRRAQAKVGEWITVSAPGDPDERKMQFTSAMADLTQKYVDTVRKMSIGHELHVEQRLEFSKFVATEDQFGTTDASFTDWDNGELVVADAKFGHQPVDVVKNPQLMTYALGSLAQMYEAAMAQPQEADDDLSD